MRILDRYILKSIFTIFIGTVLTFAFLFILIDLFSNLQDFIAKSVGITVILRYYLSFLPSIIVQTSTMACLIAVLFTYSNLNAHNEIIAIRASGMNFWQIARPALVFALFISASVFLVNEKFVPTSSMINQEIHDTQINLSPSQRGKGLPLIHNLTFYGLKNRLFFIDTFDPNTHALQGITIIGHDHNQNPVEKIVAENGVWTGIAWKFYKCQITTYSSVIPNAVTGVHMYAEKLMDIPEKPKDFMSQRIDLSSMNLRQLHAYIKRFSGSGAVKTLNDLRVDMHQKITFPLRNFVIVLIGLPFALMSIGKRKAMTFTSIAIALVIGFLYYVADAVGLALAKGGALLPWEGAWITPILFTLAALFIIFRNF
ncbi:MAG: LptF/LptG family permease [Candidatus Omnitrophica bacterium]|nr:LptF/LptG family permease [Candidatus Omnitrophota bacterium]MDE2008460.1 LptF/LptG family permease [Candidatus Omnitrophota bacterium]MDE2214798.1 LptF/LptG family permease [Candidatus Omnitrophota bacterium]MDE2231419.1 LptF/LptG family permease [Candidatus Omnitrophota bacterium]